MQNRIIGNIKSILGSDLDISSFSAPEAQKVYYIIYSDMPQYRGIGKNELLIPSKSPPFSMMGVVRTEIDGYITA